MKIPTIISNEDWDLILDTVNEFPKESKPPLNLKELYRNSLAKYRLPGLFKD